MTYILEMTAAIVPNSREELLEYSQMTPEAFVAFATKDSVRRKREMRAKRDRARRDLAREW